MAELRSFILHYRKLTLMLLVVSLCVKALVPAGFMVERKTSAFTVSICADGIRTILSKPITIPMKHDPASQGGDHGKQDGRCAFTSLGSGTLEPIDPLLLAIALLFALSLGLIAVRKRHILALLRLRPPAQAPPLFC